MTNEETILEGYSDLEKGAYLGAIAALATADRQASEEELQQVEALCNAAQLSSAQKEAVLQAATELSGEELNRCLDILKNSELRYSLVADLMTFAKADNDYSEPEKQYIQKISNYLGVNQQQFSLLNQFANQADNATTETPTQQNFLGGGLKEKMQSAGINTNGLLKGVLGIAAPIIIGSMLSRGLGRRGMGGFGGGMGGFGMGGGLGSLINMLGGGRGMGSMGGLFGRMFGRGF